MMYHVCLYEVKRSFKKFHARKSLSESLQEKVRKEKRQPLNKVAFLKMAGLTGLEPATSGVTGRRCNRLYYSPAKKRMGNIE